MKKTILFFTALGFILTVLQFSTSALVDPDGYYHIKAVQIINERGFPALIKFPHLTQSIWQTYNADLSLGFHLILIPFVLLFGGLIGIKILSIVSALLVFVVFWKTLRSFDAPHPFLWTALLFLGSSTFLFRMTLPRGLIFAIISQILIFLFLSKKRYFPIFLTIFAYSWLHASALLAIVFGAVFFFVRRFFGKRFSWPDIAVPLAGYFAGIALRPDFPDNLRLLFIQDFGPLIERMQGFRLNWASELSSPSLLTIADNSFLIMIIWAAGLALMFVKPNEHKAPGQNTPTYATGLISLLFFLMMLTSHRFVDFFAPSAILFAALAAKPVLEKININDYLKKWRAKHKISLVLICAFIILLALKNFVGAFSSASATEPLKKFQAAAFWLKENTPENSIAFHTDWDDFPKLFYYNDRNRYLVGMDPTFMYEYDKKIYWLWRNISDSGVVSDHYLSQKEINGYKKLQNPKLMAQTIKDKFNSNIIFVPKERALLNELLLNSPDQFKEVYSDQWVKIFKIL